MVEDKRPKTQSGSRPKAKTLLRIDLDNAYSRLEVSPLDSTEEIANKIANLRAAAIRRIRQKPTIAPDDKDQAEVNRLDRISEEIGDSLKRKMYDQENPQNLLLTVQPSQIEQSSLRYRRAGLISEWLYDELGEDCFLPSPRCLHLWAPSGVGEAVLNFILCYVEQVEDMSAQHSFGLNGECSNSQPTVVDLDRTLKEE